MPIAAPDHRFGVLRAIHNVAATCFGLLALLTSAAAFAQQPADTIITHGKILTVDPAFQTVEALAITNGRIVATGTSAQIARYAGKNTKTLDVAGATVIPGLIDNHFHFTRGVETWHEQARFEGVDTRREALRILAAKAASLKPGDWIMVQGGWTQKQFADAPGGFTLEELDGAAPRNPLFVQEGYGTVYANSLALKAVGLNPADGARRPAQGLVSFQPPYALYDAMPRVSPAQRDQNLTDFMHELNSTGLTGVYSLGQSDFLAARAAKGALPVRLWETLNFNATDPASAAKAAELIARTRPNQFDGQYGIFGLGEVLYGPFFDLAPRKDHWPAQIMSEYGKLATAAARAGWHVHQHVINNNAVTDLLDTLEQVNKTQPITGLRWTLGHVYDISPANIARAKAMGMTLGVHGAAMQAGGAHAPATDCRQRHRVRPRHRRDDRFALQPVRDARLGGQRSRCRRQQGAGSDADARGSADRAHALERVSVLPGKESRLARGRQAGGPGRARPRLHDSAGGADPQHQADDDDGWRTRGV
ncbi:MAG: amidohydrolase family protein [Gammaproteobacteria bacterium]